jgi:hypothetical protein
MRTILLLGWVSLVAAQTPGPKTGPEVGAAAPGFSLVDQGGKTQTLESLMGAKGLMLVFFRSADW